MKLSNKIVKLVLKIINEANSELVSVLSVFIYLLFVCLFLKTKFGELSDQDK